MLTYSARFDVSEGSVRPTSERTQLNRKGSEARRNRDNDPFLPSVGGVDASERTSDSAKNESWSRERVRDYPERGLEQSE